MMKQELLIQDKTYRRLADWLERLPHALLLHGPRGIGKLQLAERFAQFLLCEARGSGAEPCGRCDGCRWSLAGNHPDLRIVEPDALARSAASVELDDAAPAQGSKTKGKPSLEIRIEQVRALDAFVHMGSHRGKRRVAIIHPAEDMNLPTANALLKNLEEPPPGAFFLLVAHRPARLLPTIRSRCVQVPVPLPDAAIATGWLEAQGAQDAARWLAFSGGAPLRALEYAGEGRGERIAAWRKALEGGDLDAIDPGGDREDLEFLVDLVQKHALDAALACAGLEPKYGTRISGSGPASLRQWLTFARETGRTRALARHPLNPRLFAADLLGRLPGRGS